MYQLLPTSGQVFHKFSRFIWVNSEPLGQKKNGEKAYLSDIEAQPKKPEIQCTQPSSNLTFDLWRA